MNGRFDWWCKTAVDQIRYGPDRKAVYEELYAHLQDRYEAELDRWETPEEAAEATLRAMGSASELAPQLAAVHRPFWGYVLRISQWVLRFSVLLLGFVLVVFLMRHAPSEQYIPWYYETKESGIARPLEDGTGEQWKAFDIDPGSTDASDGFFFDASRAVMTCYDSYLNDERDGTYFHFQIDVYSLLNWDQLNQIPIHDFWAVDSLGNVYCCYNQYMENNQHAVCGNLNRNGLCSRTMDLWLINFCSQDADWL